jgi:uncharacterized paraquat-inducible protein A
MKTELYKLTCHQCDAQVELPAGRADETECRNCPRCGADIEIAWRATRAGGESA